MIKSLLNKILISFGKKYQIDNKIDYFVLLSFIYQRVVMLLRGLLMFRKKVFIGHNVSFIQKSNLFLGIGTTIESNTIFDCCAANKVFLSSNVKIGRSSTITITSHLSYLGKGLTIGSNSAIGEFSHIGCAGGVSIGNDVIMGAYVSFHSENHNFKDPNSPIRLQGVTHKGIKIGNNVWVGAKVTFIDGSSIGNNCVIAAGAIVTDNFPDNVLIGGVPAKIIKKIYE
jgi:acetyltransferase-like isoleucine patch superfamily enzyme